MAIDHGLQGRDSINSKRKRASKARKIKAIAHASLTKDRKVLFNEESRVDWITGFHKRKQLRQRYGVAMQIIKDKKVTKEKTREKRNAMKPEDDDHDHDGDSESNHSSSLSKRQLKLLSHDNDKVDNDNDSDDDQDNESIIFNDAQTTSMFGSAVMVDIDPNVGNKLQLDPWSKSESGSISGSMMSSTSQKAAYHEVFSKAIKKAKVLLGNKKSKRKKEIKGLQLKAKLSGSKGTKDSGKKHGSGKKRR